MGFCLKLGCVVFCCLGAGASVLAAGSSFVSKTNAPPRIRSVVRADARSGRLVRTVVVTPRVVPAEESAGEKPGAVEGNPDPAASVTDLVEAAARKHNVDPLLVHSVIQVESSYNPYAVSPKGAQGLMQLMPGTARRFGVSNAFDVKDNIEGGVRYLKYLQSLFPHDPRLAVAAYNAGEGAVWKYNNQIPPYRETEQYVNRVGKKYGQAKREAEQQKKAEPLPPVQLADAAPVQAPVSYFVDSEGRLHMRNVDSPAGGGFMQSTTP